MSSFRQDLRVAYNDPQNPVMKYIIINAAVFVVVAITNVLFLLMNKVNPVQSFALDYLTLPASLYSLMLRPWSVITYMFLHIQFFHVLFNMLVLFWFGNLLVEYLGKKKFIYTYFIGGIAGGILYIAFFNIFPLFESSLASAKALGASASVMAVVFSTATLLPDYSIRLAIFGEIRLKYIALFYLVIDIIGVGSLNSGGHIAHIGGALAGFLLIRQLRRGNDWINKLDKLVQKINPFKKRTTIKVSHRSAGKPATEHTGTKQETIDKLLDKISQSGYESLTKQEKEILFKASGKE